MGIADELEAKKGQPDPDGLIPKPESGRQERLCPSEPAVFLSEISQNGPS